MCKALCRHSGWSRELKITVLVMNWPFLSFTKCCAILGISWAGVLVGQTLLWSVYTKLQGPPAENWCGGRQVKITFYVMHEELFSKAERESLSGAIAFHFPCHFFLKTALWVASGLGFFNWEQMPPNTINFVPNVGMITGGACVLIILKWINLALDK